MKIIDIISSSRRVMDTTFSLFLSESHVKSNTTVTRCMDILKEVNSIMKLIINYLLRNFEDSELVTSKNKNCPLVFKTDCSKSIENILLVRKARFLMKESSLLRKKFKKSLITSDSLKISISYTT
jgi:hypothetical protein